MYLYEVKYFSKKDNQWRTYKTMLYEKPEAALREAENFERHLEFAVDILCITKTLVEHKPFDPVEWLNSSNAFAEED